MNASIAPQPTRSPARSSAVTPAPTIDPAQAAHFGRLAADWWDPTGSSAMLHRLNPVRLRYIRDAVDAHWAGDAAAFRPLAGRRALDVGCGAGLLAEPLARLGAAVTGIDAAPENVAVARAHAEGQGLAIDYRAGELASLAGETFDLVTCMEVIEHVADPAGFVAGLAAALAPDGLLVLSTPNRTPLSRLAMITLGEGLGRIPRGTHDWSRFLTPDELQALLEAAGLRVADVTGLAFSPLKGLVLSDSLALDYLMVVRKA
ncbi:bifunctional 2-polyprenyl-6-hydroxyphenol methylase/3-demethylubiquinol 3-O-methyltransferase UbiG [Sphingomonas profundi]|uniref:bifunctional 2-polyprenyl-6-hydroxyphenol methylase/3-demethylubiquinol 3-O-methyltransferase UbiG n=1 Tax=Alterirhizorhabdus profundi TaxID=2681549 RepID=UPI0012E9133A|nr:bifunctional 2-polyprenyl-6-hydroxyphenol methylase/3-demethylubiquinol 3-O-methyltransferase UbiG [Sphingomonas profundi]